jgi:hypothetical protein
MKKKIESFLSAAFVLALTVPALANAQFAPPTRGDTGISDAPVSQIIVKVMNWLLYIVGFLGVIGFAIAGILYLTAAGDDDRINQAKRAMLFSILGVVVALAGLVVVYFISGILNVDPNNAAI